MSTNWTHLDDQLMRAVDVEGLNAPVLGAPMLNRKGLVLRHSRCDWCHPERGAKDLCDHGEMLRCPSGLEAVLARLNCSA